MKLITQTSFISFCFAISLQAASTFYPDGTTLQFTGGTVDTSEFGTDKDKGDEFTVGSGNSYIEFTSQATIGNLSPLANPTFITSTVSGNGGSFDLILQAAVQDSDALAQQTATTNRTFVRHRIRSNGTTNSYTFTQSYSKPWSPSDRFSGAGINGNLNWSLAQAVNIRAGQEGAAQDASLLAIDVRYYDENLNLIDLTGVDFKPDANNSGNGNAASFTQAGTTATMIYNAAGDQAGLNLIDLNTGNIRTEYIGKIEYTFRTTDGSDIADGVSFQYTTNGTNYADIEVIPEPASVALLGLGVFSLCLRRKR